MIDFNKYIYSTGIHYIANSGSDENSGTQVRQILIDLAFPN